MKLQQTTRVVTLLAAMMAGIGGVHAATWTLDKVVTLTRHGVRPQTNTAKLDKGTGLTWPKFEVPDGHLTGHGYAGMWQQGRYLLNQWQQEGLPLSHTCPQTQEVFLWTSPSQRIKATGKALADGMFPGCGLAPLSVPAKYGPLFELYHLHAAHPDQAVMAKQITARLGTPKQMAARYHDGVALLRQTVCAKDKHSCQFLEKPWGIGFKSTGKPELKGPGKLGATIGETIRLQYSDNLPVSSVAFGHGTDAQAVKALMALHEAQYEALDTSEFAAHAGSLLMRQILSALTAGTSLQAQWPGDPRLQRPLVMLVGHDTNIAEIQTLLGFNWTLAGYPANDVPPGGTLSFARFHRGDQSWVRVRFSARSLDQWRTLTPLNRQHPLERVDLTVPGCQQTAVGTLCPLQTVVTLASRWLVNDGRELAVFQTDKPVH